MRKVEELNAAGSPDEKDMDRYLKAHDDLQTVLRVYDAVLDGNEPLPLSRGAADAAARGTGEASAAAEAAFAAAAGANGNSGGGGAYSSDDDSVEDGAVGGGKGARAKAAGAAGASGGRSSPAKGNLLDLEENAPLETGMTGEGAGGMLVAYAGGGQFMASNTNSVGGVSGVSGVSGVGGVGFDSSSSGPQGSATASNFASASDTGAVYGSNQFGSNSNQFGSNNFGSSNFSSGGGGGEGPSGFGKSMPCGCFPGKGGGGKACFAALLRTAWNVPPRAHSCLFCTRLENCWRVIVVSAFHEGLDWREREERRGEVGRQQGQGPTPSFS